MMLVQQKPRLVVIYGSNVPGLQGMSRRLFIPAMTSSEAIERSNYIELQAGFRPFDVFNPVDNLSYSAIHPQNLPLLADKFELLLVDSVDALRQAQTEGTRLPDAALQRPPQRLAQGDPCPMKY